MTDEPQPLTVWQEGTPRAPLILPPGVAAPTTTEEYDALLEEHAIDVDAKPWCVDPDSVVRKASDVIRRLAEAAEPPAPEPPHDLDAPVPPTRVEAPDGSVVEIQPGQGT